MSRGLLHYLPCSVAMSLESRQRPRKVATFDAGERAADRFAGAMLKVLTVTKEEIVRREAASKDRKANKRKK